MDPTDWLPFYPDLPPPRLQRPPGWIAEVAYSSEAFPIPDLLAGLTFAPSFPDRLPPRFVSPVQTSVDAPALIEPAWSPLVWQGWQSAWLPPARLAVPQLAGSTAPPPSEQVVIAQGLAWQAKGDLGPPARRLPPVAGGGWSIDPSLLTVPCVELGLEAGTTTDLITELATAPALIDEALAVTGLITEDVC